jgi:hypothetical protein
MNASKCIEMAFIGRDFFYFVSKNICKFMTNDSDSKKL